VADKRGSPRLFRADRVASATITDAPVRRRAGVELAEVWEALRRRVEERPRDARVRARVRRSKLDLFLRISGGYLAGPPDLSGEGEWAGVTLAYERPEWVAELLRYGTDVEVTEPPEARRALARAAASVAALYAEGGEDAG
jgi:predicted DNA-binding transcriptional regulator YafY